MFKKNKCRPGWILFVFLLLAGFFALSQTVSDDYFHNKETNIQTQTSRPLKEVVAFYSINIRGNEVVFIDSFENGTTVLEGLSKVSAREDGFEIKIDEYEGLGSLVTAIASLENGADNKYWQYLVNNKMPMIGAGQYVLEDGDKVQWKFAESGF